MYTMTLADQYAEVCAAPSDVVGHLPTFVALVVESDAKIVIELGTRTGVSTIAWLYGLAQTGGHLWSVDLDDRPQIGTHDRWTFLQGDDCDPAIYGQLPGGADIVFIDTSHAFVHTSRELSLYRWLVRPGGRIVLHDTELAHPVDIPPERPYPVRRAIEQFCAAEGLTWTNDPTCWGLGQIVIP